jgi:cobalt/nickel transport system permease protein
MESSAFAIAFMPELHIPDGFLSVAVSGICWLITIGLLGVAVRRTQSELGERQIPLMGIMAAFIFAAQMLNFPVAGGTSGHMLGGALAAIALGPWAGMLVMGADMLIMGLFTALIGFGLYRTVLGRPLGVRLAVAGAAAWISVVASAFVTSIQLVLSGTSPLAVVMPAMLGVHALIGIGEALITVAALSFIARTRPELLDTETAAARGGQGWAVSGLLVALAVVLLSPFASADPDGLERVAGDIGFLALGQGNTLGPLPDYTVPFLGETPLSTIAAGLIGALIVAGLAFLLARTLRRRTLA